MGRCGLPGAVDDPTGVAGSVSQIQSAITAALSALGASGAGLFGDRSVNPLQSALAEPVTASQREKADETNSLLRQNNDIASAQLSATRNLGQRSNTPDVTALTERLRSATGNVGRRCE